MGVSFFEDGVNPIGLLILVGVGGLMFFLNKKMSSSDNENIRRLQKISDTYTKIQFGFGVVFVIFILILFMAFGNK